MICLNGILASSQISRKLKHWTTCPFWKPFFNNCHVTQIASTCGPASRLRNCGKPHPSYFSQVKATTIVEWPVFQQYLTSLVSESVDCSCRDGADTLIIRVHTKAFLKCGRSYSLQPAWLKWHYSGVLYQLVHPQESITEFHFWVRSQGNDILSNCHTSIIRWVAVTWRSSCIGSHHK